jgi:hypothetical protein
MQLAAKKFDGEKAASAVNSFIAGALWHANKEVHDHLPGFIEQFKPGGDLQELVDDDWTVSSFLSWLSINRFKIIKK